MSDKTPFASLIEDKSISPLLSQDEWQKIKEISDRYPEKKPSIYDRFRFFVALEKEQRPALAYKVLKMVKRAGVVQRGYTGDNVESIHDHSWNGVYALKRIFRNQALV